MQQQPYLIDLKNKQVIAVQASGGESEDKWMKRKESRGSRNILNHVPWYAYIISVD